MKRIHVPGVVDIVQTEDANEIKSFAGDTNLDRAYADHSVLANGKILRQVHDILQIDGKSFPTVSARSAPGRAEAQDGLWKRLTALAPAIAEGPEELEPLAAFVRGAGSPDSGGLLAQQVVGALFAADFKATADSWNAAVLLGKAPHTLNPLQLAEWAITKEIDKAKALLAGMVNGDLSAVHAIGIAVHNIVNGVNLMRELYGDPNNRTSLTAESAGSRCIFAPDKVLRQPNAPENSAEGELETSTVVILNLQAANAKAPDRDIAFLRGTWSQCPAESWVPALLIGIWRRACSMKSAS